LQAELKQQKLFLIEKQNSAKKLERDLYKAETEVETMEDDHAQALEKLN
jgi:predicted methyltransferase MtxX (methanogen marker protein 4)